MTRGDRKRRVSTTRRSIVWECSSRAERKDVPMLRDIPRDIAYSLAGSPWEPARCGASQSSAKKEYSSLPAGKVYRGRRGTPHPTLPLPISANRGSEEGVQRTATQPQRFLSNAGARAEWAWVVDGPDGRRGRRSAPQRGLYSAVCKHLRCITLNSLAHASIRLRRLQGFYETTHE